MNSPLILYRRYEKFIMDAFSAQNLTPDIFCLCDDARGAMLWVREGLAVAIFPESMRCFCEGLHIETLAEPALETKILLIWKKGKQPTSLVQKFSGYMHEINCVSCGAAGAIRRYRRKASRKITPTGFSVI